MRVTIQRENGARAETLLLAVSKQRLRVAAVEGDDTEEFTNLEGKWFDEHGQIIELEALMAVDPFDSASFFAEIWPLTATAGSRRG